MKGAEDVAKKRAGPKDDRAKIRSLASRLGFANSCIRAAEAENKRLSELVDEHSRIRERWRETASRLREELEAARRDLARKDRFLMDARDEATRANIKADNARQQNGSTYQDYVRALQERDQAIKERDAWAMRFAGWSKKEIAL
jgi:hypothetical protein